MKITTFLFKTITVLSSAILLMTGCNKDDEVLDPNIVFKETDFKLTNTTTISDPDQELPFDIDGDGIDDFKIDAEFEVIGGDTTVTMMELQSTNMDNKVLTESFTFPGGPTTNALKSLSEGTKINSSSEFNEYGFASVKVEHNSAVVATFGFTDAQDKLVGFSFKIGSQTHYGWLSVFVSSNLQVMRVKEVAYHKIANTEIAAGDK